MSKRQFNTVWIKNIENSHGIETFLYCVFKNYKRTDGLFITSSPFPSLLICIVYLMFVTKWGPRFMENRKPLKIDILMIVYNIIQVLANLILVILATVYILPSYNIYCTPIDYSNNPTALLTVRLGHTYFMIKILDLMDTVFIVLRKKQNQASFLHVYHHFGMVGASWYTLRYYPGGHIFYVPFVNSIVHVFMYFYYLLTSLNEKYKKSIWWKKYITQLQLLQFMILLVMFTHVFLDDSCSYPKTIVYLYLPQNMLFLYLFGNFYWNAYIKPRRRADKKEEGKEL